ncbi:hypothetical protein ACLB2K_058112 [Fragaria x ananassa]
MFNYAMKNCGMADTTVVISSPSRGLVQTKEYSVVKLHTCIISLIGILGFCLQLKFPNVSPYATIYGSQLMNVFIIVTCIYILSLIVMTIQASRRDNADLEDPMNILSLFLGSLSLNLELLVLLSPFGMILLFLWCICLLWFVSNSYQSLKTLFQNAVEHLVRSVGELKRKLVDLNRRLMDSNAIAAVARASQKLKDLITRDEGRVTEHEAQNQNHTSEGTC